MDKYTSIFEEKYWDIVNEKISGDYQKKILKSCTKYLPGDFFDFETPTFKKLVLASFAKLKMAEKYIKNVSMNKMKAECFAHRCKKETVINDLYIQIYKAFEKVMDAQRHKTSTRVQIVRESGFTVCPYCNRDYINCRADHVSGAQLDHFYSRSNYPVFAVSLYNLVPVCGNCNRIKNNKEEEFASLFDDTIDWDKDIKFGYHPKSMDHIEILELQDKQQAYSKSQKEEIRKVLNDIQISDDEIKRIVFGPKIMSKDMRKKPLGKMLSDIHKEMKIY